MHGELALYPLEQGADWPMIVVPDVVGRTVEKTRGVVRVESAKAKPQVPVDDARVYETWLDFCSAHTQSGQRQ